MKKKIIWNYKHYNCGMYRKCLACYKPKTYVFFMLTKIMDKNILGKRIIVCAKWALRKRRVNETIVCEKFYSLLSLRSLNNLFHIMKQRYWLNYVRTFYWCKSIHKAIYICNLTISAMFASKILQCFWLWWQCYLYIIYIYIYIIHMLCIYHGLLIMQAM